MSVTVAAVKNALSNVLEPDLKKDIVALELVENIKIDGQKISLDVRVSNPAMHSRRRMVEACEFAIHRVLGKEFEVDTNVLSIENDNANYKTRKVLPGVKNIIAVASGKGGVGKSTVATNLAAGLAKRGYSVGFVDADIYGPSAPIMFDLVQDKPKTIEIDGKTLIEPLESYGVKLLSIGFFADTSQAIVWRGPMAGKALNQMFSDAHWGDLDYMIVDLPPGTGDIHLSLVQAVPLTGAVIVSTPQEIALADAKKGVGMFKLPSINVPVLGLIENMSYFTPAELPKNKYYIFGKEGAKQLAEDIEVAFLGEIPLVQSIREAGDVGRPAVLQDGTASEKAFLNILDKFEAAVAERNANLAPTQAVKMNN